MFNRKVSIFNNSRNARCCRFEPLESRQLLSVSPSVTLIGPGNTTGAMAVPFDVPVHYGIDGWFSDGSSGAIDYTVVVNNEDGTVNTDITAQILSGNRSVKITVEDVDGDGQDEVMILELFEHLVPEFTTRFIDMVESGFYDSGVDGSDMTFHRIVDNFMIQGGDPLGTGSGGSGPDGTTGDEVDDMYHPDARFIGQGVLGSAKSFDDTNDCQFFITDTDTRHLDFQHTIFGQLSEGADAEDLISAVSVTDTVPDTPVVIKSMEIIDDSENATLFISIPEGTVLTGGETVMITATTAGAPASESVFGIEAYEDTWNSLPYMPFGEIGTEVSADDAIVVVEGSSTQFTIPANDVDGDPIYYAAWDAHTLDTGLDSEFNITYDATTGLTTLSPLADIEGNCGIWLGVTYVSTDWVDYTASTHPNDWFDDLGSEIYSWSYDDYYSQFINYGYDDTTSQYYADYYAQNYGWGNYLSSWDFQFVPVFVTPDAPTDITLQSADDTGESSIDLLTNIDNSTQSLSFTVSGVTAGRTVVVEIDGQEWGRAVVPAGVDWVTVDTSATAAILDEGTHGITARQVFNADSEETTQVGNLSIDAPVPSDPTSLLTITVDATPLAFTTSPSTSVIADYTYSYLPSVDAADLWRYELVDDTTYDIPSDMTIDPSTGQVTWTPTIGQVGTHQAAIRAIDSAGNETIQDMTITVVEQEITIEVAIVETPTGYDGSTGAPISEPAGGGVNRADLPIVEWSNYYVEIWVTPSEGASGVWLDLDYNGDYHVPVTIEYGPAFTDNQSGTINEAIDQIENLGASTDRSDLGDGRVLLARVSFAPVSGAAGVPLEYDSVTGDLQLVASGIAVDATYVELTAGGTFDQPTIYPPEAWLAPAIYDLNDNGSVDIADLSLFAARFGAIFTQGSDTQIRAADFNDSGTVDIADLSYFAANFGTSAGDTQTYPDGWLESLTLPESQPQAMIPAVATQAMILPLEEETNTTETELTIFEPTPTEEAATPIDDSSSSADTTDNPLATIPLAISNQSESNADDEIIAVDSYFTELEEAAPVTTQSDDQPSELTDTLTDDLLSSL